MSEPVPADQVPDPEDLRIRLPVNGAVRQDSKTKEMVFGIPRLIATASRIMTLEPGDVMATGTPSGVWPIAHGDILDAGIQGVGRLPCTVAARNR